MLTRTEPPGSIPAFWNSSHPVHLVGDLLHHCFFWPVLEKSGLPMIGFCDLCHCGGYPSIDQGINPKVIREMLGHSSITLTLDTYSHVLPTMQREAREAWTQSCADKDAMQNNLNIT
ncbi:MAG: hypothetical protein Q7R39_02265 [Dehalococcoidia bacterium]|nr:hypothetical protein [Dehalococcoidia bacterium]